MDPISGVSYDEPSPNNFSFNSPYGACQACTGLGEQYKADIQKIIPDRSKSIQEEGIKPFGAVRDNSTFKQIRKIAEVFIDNAGEYSRRPCKSCYMAVTNPSVRFFSIPPMNICMIWGTGRYSQYGRKMVSGIQFKPKN